MPRILYLFLRWCPGALGIFLRQRLYSRLLGKCGRNVLIGRYVDMHNPKGISLADNVILNEYSRLDAGRSAGGRASLFLGQGVFIGAGTVLAAGPGELIIEEGNNIGSGCLITATHDTVLEHHALLAGYCRVGAAEPATEEQGMAPDAAPRKTRIGAGCWLGLRSQIAAGIEIGEGAIVGAHSIVYESLPDYAIAFGRPAKIRRMRP
jgi:acetyltransferase-like isoleucine patch superfamily enzyme